MSSVINNSNSNSALISVLDNSDSLVNPNVYSIKPIYPPHAMTYSPNQSTTGGDTATSNTVLNFQLNKYGIVSQVLFRGVYHDTTATPAAFSLAATAILSCIERIDLLSSSRVVSSLTKFDLLAQFSDLSQAEYNAVQQACIGGRGVAGGGTNAAEYAFAMPIVFGFMENIDTQLNCSFLETQTIRVTFGTFATAKAMKDIKMDVRYKNYDESQSSKILAENFDQPTLNMLSSRYYDETVKQHPVTAPVSPATKVTNSVIVDLKNTDCVNDFFVIVTDKTADDAITSGQVLPVPISSIVLSGSGQTLVELDQYQLHYARLGKNGFSERVSNGEGLANIAKVQMGCSSDYQMLTNTLSLREINNPQITVTFDSTTTTVYEVRVVEKCSALYSISSATGRLALSLSN